MNMLKQTLAVSVLSVMMIGTVSAAPAEKPEDFVKRVADDLIKRLNSEKEKGKFKDPKTVRAIINENLNPYLDAQGFALTVMGKYGKAPHSTPQLRKKFENNLRETLISTYGSALAKFDGEGYRMLRSSPSQNSKFASINIEFDPKDSRIPVTFQLVDLNNQWKIRNMSVSGVNLGVQFKNQFEAEVSKNGSNVERAVNTFKPNADNVGKK